MMVRIFFFSRISWFWNQNIILCYSVIWPDILIPGGPKYLDPEKVRKNYWYPELSWSTCLWNQYFQEHPSVPYKLLFSTSMRSRPKHFSKICMEEENYVKRAKLKFVEIFKVFAILCLYWWKHKHKFKVWWCQLAKKAIGYLRWYVGFSFKILLKVWFPSILYRLLRLVEESSIKEPIILYFPLNGIKVYQNLPFSID